MEFLKEISGDKTAHYLPPRKVRGRAKPQIRLPLTPMIDITFQLLLFFLLATEFRQTEGQIPATLPRQAGGMALSKPIEKPLWITLRVAGQDNQDVVYEIGGQKQTVATPEKLYESLMQCRIAFGDNVPMIIQPGTNVRWEYVVEVFNQAVRAKFRNIGFPSGG